MSFGGGGAAAGAAMGGAGTGPVPVTGESDAVRLFRKGLRTNGTHTRMSASPEGDKYNIPGDGWCLYASLLSVFERFQDFIKIGIIPDEERHLRRQLYSQQFARYLSDEVKKSRYLQAILIKSLLLEVGENVNEYYNADGTLSGEFGHRTDKILRVVDSHDVINAASGVEQPYFRGYKGATDKLYVVIPLGEDLENKSDLMHEFINVNPELTDANYEAFLLLVNSDTIHLDEFLDSMWKHFPNKDGGLVPYFFGDYRWLGPVVAKLLPWIKAVVHSPTNASPPPSDVNIILEFDGTAHYTSCVLEYVPDSPGLEAMPASYLEIAEEMYNKLKDISSLSKKSSILTQLELSWKPLSESPVPVTPSITAGLGMSGIPLGAPPVLVQLNKPDLPRLSAGFPESKDDENSLGEAAKATGALMEAVATAAEKLQGGGAGGLPSAGAAEQVVSSNGPPVTPIAPGPEPAPAPAPSPAPAPAPAPNTEEPVPSPAPAPAPNTEEPIPSPAPAPSAGGQESDIPPTTQGQGGTLVSPIGDVDLDLGPLTAEDEKALNEYIRIQGKPAKSITYKEIPDINPEQDNITSLKLSPKLRETTDDLKRLMASLPAVPTGEITVSPAVEHPLITRYKALRAYANAIYEEVSAPEKEYSEDLLVQFKFGIKAALINLTFLEEKAKDFPAVLFIPSIEQTRRSFFAIEKFIDAKINKERFSIRRWSAAGNRGAAGGAAAGQSTVTGTGGGTPPSGQPTGSSVPSSGAGGTPPSGRPTGAGRGGSDLDTRLLDVERELENLQKQLPRIGVTPSAELASARTKIDAIQAQMRQAIDLVNQRIGALDTTIGKLGNSVTELRQSQPAQAAQFSALGGQIAGINEQLAALQGQGPQVTPGEVAALHTAVAALQTQIDALPPPVVGGGAAGAQPDLTQQVGALQTQVANLEAAIATYQDTNQHVTEQINGLSAQLTANIQAVTNQIADVSGLVLAETGRAQIQEASLSASIAAARVAATIASQGLQRQVQRQGSDLTILQRQTAAEKLQTDRQIAAQTAARQALEQRLVGVSGEILAARQALEQRLMGVSGDVLNTLTELAMLRASVGGLQAAARAQPGVLASRRRGPTSALLPTSGRLSDAPGGVAGLLKISWLNPNPSGACTESLLSTGDCTTSHIARDICGFDAWVTGWIGGAPRLGNATQLAYARDICGGMTPEKMAAAYPDNTIYIDGSSYIVRNPYATLGERLSQDLSSGFFMRGDVNGGLGLNAQVLQAYASPGIFKEFLTDNRRAIAVLEALWHCGRSGGHDGSPQCYPARVIEEIREYNLLKEQTKAQQLAEEALKLGGWKRVSGYLSKALAMLPKSFGRAAPPAPAPSPAPAITGATSAAVLPPLGGGAGGAASGSSPAPTVGSTTDLLLGLGIGTRRSRALPFREIIPDLSPGLGFHPS